MKVLTVFALLLFSGSLLAQVDIVEEPKVQRLMESYTSFSKSSDEIQAWRIQLVTTNDRRKMEAVRLEFRNLYPEIDLSWKHVSPYYYVQVGAYRTKLELQGFLLELKQDFPNAIPVMVKIRKTELIQK